MSYFVPNNFYNFAWRKTRTKWHTYRRDWKEYGYKRLFMKKRTGTEQEILDEKLFGVLFHDSNYGSLRWYDNIDRKVFQFIPRRVNKLLFGKPYEININRAVMNGLEKKLLKKDWRFSTPVRLLIALPPSIALWSIAYNWLDKKTAEKQKKIIKNKVKRLLNSDYRYRDIKRQLEEGEISEEVAIEMAANRLSSLNTYFEVMNKLYEKELRYDDLETTLIFLQDKDLIERTGDLFHRVWSYNQEEFWAQDQFEFEGDKKLDEDEIHELYKITHKKIYMMESLRLFYESKSKGEEPKVSKDLKEYLTDPMVGMMMDYENKGMKKEKVLNWLMDDIDWKSRFSEWEVLKASPKKIEGNRVTAEPLDHFTIRMEMLGAMDNEIRE